jgi:hypothetical protein
MPFVKGLKIFPSGLPCECERPSWITNLTYRCFGRYSPQLYVAGEFIGGSDIMIEMYQNGELAEMIEKAKAEMM